MLPNYFDTDVAEQYDDPADAMFSPEVLGPTVDLLADLAGAQAALELAIGTGRVALPLSERGVRVQGSSCPRPWSSSCGPSPAPTASR